MSVSTIAAAGIAFHVHSEVYGGDAYMGEAYTSHAYREDSVTYAANNPVLSDDVLPVQEWIEGEVVIGGECSHPDAIIVSTYSREDNSHAGKCLGCGEAF